MCLKLHIIQNNNELLKSAFSKTEKQGYILLFLKCLPLNNIYSVIQSRSLKWNPHLIYVLLSATPWTAAYQAPPSMAFFQARGLEWGAIAFSDLTLYNPINCSPPGSAVHGILQASILEWVVVLFSRETSQPRDRTQVSHVAGGFFTS